ncbi:MAG TPA: VWA domain-containing protein [Thermoanaerobaculia bacterium]|nr:VWA domain-containing protein [Thermoanaerobaculia bacterium]
MKRSAALGIAFGLAAAVLCAQQPPAPAPKAPGQPPQQQEEKGFPPVSESVDVSITNVDVVVTDSKGNRVPGLIAADFIVRQDGVVQNVTNFYAVTGGKIILEDGKEIALDKPESAPVVPAELKARYVFYVDNLNIQPQNRNRMFKRLKEFIPQAIGPNAEGMVVTFNHNVKVRRQFTSDVNDILGAIEQIELETGGGTNTVGERRDALQRISEAKSVTEADGIARNYAQSLRNDLEFTIDGIKETLDSLAGIQGKKSLLYISEGLPATAGYELFEAIRTKFQDTSVTMEQFDFDMNTKYLKIIQSANANGITIYTLDATGLSTPDVLSAENRQDDVQVNDFTFRQNMQGPIRMMAESTGGLAAINTNDWKQSLDQIASDFSNFYSLGYRAARGATDRPHKIDVEMKRKGLNVRFRQSFVEKSVETRTAEAVVASLSYPRADNPLQASISVGQAKPYDRNNYSLPVRISLPIGRLGMVPSGELYEGQFFVYFVVKDAAGNQSDLQIQRQQLHIPRKDFETAQKKDYYYDVTLVVVPGGQKLSVGVRDAVSNLTSYLQKSVFVSVLPTDKPPEAGPAKPGM